MPKSSSSICWHDFPVLEDLAKRLRTPHSIQAYLDGIPYSADNMTRSAYGVAQKKKAHCFDGALFAAAALEYHGFPPLLMDLRSNGNDDDHVLAIFKVHHHYGAIGKSNFIGLRFREPIYRTLRELALSYFNSYFNLDRERTLVEYSRLVDLRTHSQSDWRFSDSDTDVYDALAKRLDIARHYRLFPKKIERQLQLVDQRLLRGETVGLNKAGVFKTST